MSMQAMPACRNSCRQLNMHALPLYFSSAEAELLRYTLCRTSAAQKLQRNFQAFQGLAHTGHAACLLPRLSAHAPVGISRVPTLTKQCCVHSPLHDAYPVLPFWHLSQQRHHHRLQEQQHKQKLPQGPLSRHQGYRQLLLFQLVSREQIHATAAQQGSSAHWLKYHLP
jgi:hypothetical protein